MPSGGHAASGPPPDPMALRREKDAHLWTTLPAEGRQGEPPDWPLTEVQPREWDLWRAMWVKPQAVMWERLGQQIEVAMFCRKLSEAELPKASVELQKVIRQYLDSLGLSVQGMLRNRWRIAPAAPAGSAEGRAKTTPRRSSSRSRLTVIDGDGEN